jgi:hypothetical protein
MKTGPFARLILIMGIMAGMSGCVCMPLLLQPPEDSGVSMLSLKVPEKIETLSGLPRDESFAENGINVLTGGRQPEGIKELFRIKKGPGNAANQRYEFVLFYREEDAKKWYEMYRSDKLVQPYFMGQAADREYFVRYVVQEQTSNAGFLCDPSPYATSMTAFRLRNLYVEVRIFDKPGNSGSMTGAVKHLADLLSRQWPQ